ncbi:hypothetical protein KDW_56430 [Dictyobacter vulcani]|uniref:DUF3291 domain-containing protein n=1 Tax=Dictyobacter vulcani TaxID=2607529 RepID=A0A5J4KYA0_9CHLR|nr:hypothetical protein KDW_56430 [Dictyobacter vulcani]
MAAFLAHLGLDRWPLMHTEGLTFWRLLGVGQGRVFDPHADLQRSALFTVWRSLADLRRFEAHSRLMQRIHQRSEESWTVHMLLYAGMDSGVGVIPCKPSCQFRYRKQDPGLF